MRAKVCEEEVVRALVEKIEDAASFIEKVNESNIQELSIDDLDTNTTEFARKLIKEYNISLYDSPYADYTISIIEKLISAENKREFMDALKQYAEAMEQWAKLEEQGFLSISDEIGVDVRDVSEIIEKKEIYANYWDVWNDGQYVGRARITMFREKRKLFTKEFELHVAEIYHPSYGFSIVKINDNINEVIEDLDELVEEYENSELTSYELFEEIFEIL